MVRINRPPVFMAPAPAKGNTKRNNSLDQIMNKVVQCRFLKKMRCYIGEGCYIIYKVVLSIEL